MNWVAEIIKSGFNKTNSIKDHYDPYSHWYGVTKYQPDIRLEKDDKEILLSYSGTFMAMGINMRGMSSLSDEERILVKTCNSRYVRISKGEDVLFETFMGEIPPQEIIAKIYNQ